MRTCALPLVKFQAPPVRALHLAPPHVMTRVELHEQGVNSEECLLNALQDGDSIDLIKDIGMKAPQCKALMRFAASCAVPSPSILLDAKAPMSRCDKCRSDLRELLVRASVVPVERIFQFADKLYESGIGDFETLQESLLADPPDVDVLSADIGMLPLQKRCIMRYVSSSSSQLPLMDRTYDKDAIKDCLVDVLSRANIVPDTQRDAFAQRLYDSGIGNEETLRDCILSNPPEVDAITQIGMTKLQLKVLIQFLHSSMNAPPGELGM
jgi:hypothetical protein